MLFVFGIDTCTGMYIVYVYTYSTLKPQKSLPKLVLLFYTISLVAFRDVVSVYFLAVIMMSYMCMSVVCTCNYSSMCKKDVFQCCVAVELCRWGGGGGAVL